MNFFPRQNPTTKCRFVSITACVMYSLLQLGALPARAQSPVIPDPGAMGRDLSANISGHYSAPSKHLITDKVTDGMVTGNGDLAITVGGESSALKFYLGKADFFGVLRGAIMPVGTLTLNAPALDGSSYSLDENVGAATITGNFVKGAAALSLTSWVATAENTVVIQLKNSGSQSLALSSQLVDGFASSPGNPATYGATKNSTWLHVSPDSVYFELGNQLHNVYGKAPFTGKIADVRLFKQALSGATLASLDDTGKSTPPALLRWTAANPGAASLVGDARLNRADPHGGSVVLSGQSDSEVAVAALPLPEPQFTVSAWINLPARGGNGNIVTAQIPYPQTFGPTFPYPYVRGLTLKLVNGKLCAALNQSGFLDDNSPYQTFAADAVNKFATTSEAALPANQWVQVAVTYDGDKLTIYTNGVRVGTPAVFPSGLTDGMMGWNKMVTKLGDTNAPFNGCAPQGLVVQRVLGATTTETSQGNLAFTIPEGGTATIVVAVVTDRNTTNYFSVAQKQAQSATTDSLVKLRRQHDAWWNDFWSKSFVQIPNQRIQDSWYASLYLLACCSQSNMPPPGLWGNFNTTTAPAWLGDYTLDYNYEATFWGALACNHHELVENYEQPLLDQMSRGRATAQRCFPGNNGIYFYCHLIAAPGWDDDPGSFWGQKVNAIFAAVNCAMRWKYTQDTNYAAKIYPYLKGVADFWDNYLVLENGRYVDHHDAVSENSGRDTNPATTLSFINLVYPELVKISQILNVDADRRAKWNDIIARLTPLPVVPASSIASLNALGAPYNNPGVNVLRDATEGKAFPTPMVKVYQDHNIRTSSAGMSSCQAVYPGWNIGMESDPALYLAASNTFWLAAQWYDYNNECNFYPGAACAGYDPTEILTNLDTFLTHYRYKNFAINVEGGGTEHYAIVPATLAAMFVQSYQTNIHVFPNWIKNQSAKFGNLNACGGFLVSSAITLGQPEYVRIESTAGQMLKLANPWPGATVKCVSNQGATTNLFGAVLYYPTKVGEVLTLTPPAVTPVPAPRNATAVTNGNAVQITWSAVPGAQAYNVKRSTSRQGPYYNLANVPAATGYTDASVGFESTYHYAVSALVPGAESPDSTSTAVTTPAKPPVPLPTIFKEHSNFGSASEGSYVETGPAAVTLSSPSRDIWDTADSFEFAWQKMDGDGTITCQVVSFDNSIAWSKAGVMIRETTSNGARNVALLVTPGNGVTLQHRYAVDAPTEYIIAGGMTAPCWVKLDRRGNAFYAALSKDGVTWSAATGSPINLAMESRVLIGLALSAHEGQTVTAVFDHIKVTSKGK
jgi:hypothetical protein